MWRKSLKDLFIALLVMLFLFISWPLTYHLVANDAQDIFVFMGFFGFILSILSPVFLLLFILHLSLRLFFKLTISDEQIVLLDGKPYQIAMFRWETIINIFLKEGGQLLVIENQIGRNMKLDCRLEQYSFVFQEIIETAKKNNPNILIHLD
jgi:hypothetical protein